MWKPAETRFWEAGKESARGWRPIPTTLLDWEGLVRN